MPTLNFGPPRRGDGDPTWTGDSSSAPTDANQLHVTLTADYTMQTSDKPFVWVTPNADGWKWIMPPTFDGNQVYVRNESTTYGFDVMQNDGTSLILTLPPNYGCVFFRNASTGLWQVA